MRLDLLSSVAGRFQAGARPIRRPTPLASTRNVPRRPMRNPAGRDQSVRWRSAIAREPVDVSCLGLVWALFGPNEGHCVEGPRPTDMRHTQHHWLRVGSSRSWRRRNVASPREKARLRVAPRHSHVAPGNASNRPLARASSGWGRRGRPITRRVARSSNRFGARFRRSILSVSEISRWRTAHGRACGRPYPSRDGSLSRSPFPVHPGGKRITGQPSGTARHSSGAVLFKAEERPRHFWPTAFQIFSVR